MSGSSSKSSTNTTNTREDFVFTNSGGGESVNIGKGNTVSITGTDGETAVAALEEGRKFAEAGFSFGGDALDTVSDTFTTAAALNRDVIESFGGNLEQIVRASASQVDRSLKVAESSLTDDSAETLQSLFMYAAIGVSVVAVAFAARGR